MELRHPVIETISEWKRKISTFIIEGNDWNNKHYFPNLYSIEIGDDIEYLKKMLSIPKIEREKDEIYLYLIGKYEKNYCPCCLYKRYSFQNKLLFEGFRSEIDELLSEKDQEYSSDIFKSEE